MALAAALLAAYGVSYAYAARVSDVQVHQVDKSPEQVREFWTPEKLEEAKQNGPMPIITDR